MDDKHTNETFIHHAPENGIPLDYSFLEATEKWTNEIPLSQREYAFRREKIVKFTRDSLLFADIFSPNGTGSRRKLAPIPVELEPFFRDYVLTILNSEHSESLRMEEPDNQKLPERFGIDFFKNAHASIKQAPTILAYYEKELYNDPAFQRFAAEYYWEAEFDRRCRMLKETVLKCPPDQRISQLGHILKFLDTQIGIHAEFAARAQNMPDESGVTFLRNFTVKLFDLCRKPKLINGKRSHTYTFENISIRTNESDGKKRRSLASIFPMIRGISTAKTQGQKDKDTESAEQKANLVNMLIAAREQYLTSLSSKTTESEFYTQAHDLDSYLKSASTAYDSNTLQPIIKEIARQYYLDIFHRQNYPLVVLQKPITPDVTTAFLEGIVGSLANNFVFANWTDIQHLFPVNEEFLTETISPDVISQTEGIPMESPDLFYRLFKKYIGQEFSEYTDRDPNHTPLELLAALYYEYLFQLEFSVMTDSPDESFQTNRTSFQKQHRAYPVLCFRIRQEWNGLLQNNRQAVNQYIENPDAVFPCLDTYLHRLLFTIKLYSDYRQVIQLTEKCYGQYHSVVNDCHSPN